MRRVSVMFGRILLAVGLFSACAVLGESNENDSPETVFAFVGEDVTLPCLYKSGVSDETVEWAKVGLEPKDIYVHRDGCETFEMKNEAYEFRTHLFMRELKNGNISLRLSDVQLSDAGKYRCLTLPKENQTIKFIELVVVSTPIISITGIDSGGATLQCEVNCWFGISEPEITWLDDQGNPITAQPPRRDPDGSDCYTLRSTVTVEPTATNKFTCRVHQRTTKRTVGTKIEIPAYFMKSCTLDIVITIVVLILLVLLGIGIMWKKKADNLDKQLKSQVADLQSQLRRKDETIGSLTEQRDRLQSFEREHRVVCQHGQLTIDRSPTSRIGTKPPLDSPTPGNPPPDWGPKARNLTHDKNPKTGASPHSSYPESIKLPKNKPDFSAHDSNPTPSSPSHSNNPNHSTSDISKGSDASSSSVSDNPAEQKPSRSVCSRSGSFSGLWPGSNVSTRPSRLSSFSLPSTNRFSVLAESDPESEDLIS
ncbi:butyrophilin subfamily 3 member A2-like [Centroberyx affinis]|uniref:butyrophilin subfamily 3 member A2-like n=1 Tax=Centroberyx affinis TaxID=166261 RepID=UPI003A5C67C9